MTTFLSIFIILNIFIIGTLFGSFFSLATYRLPRKQDIVATRSYCPNCKHNLGFFDLIPVLSYIFSGGKCRYCGQSISTRYIFLELSNGVIFVLLYLIFGYTLNFLFSALIYVFIFLALGTYIMKKNMTEEEKKYLELHDKIKFKASSKRGVFISELVIALVVLTIFLASSYVTSRNYTNKVTDLIARNNAVDVAINSIEYALATNYDELSSSTKAVIVNNIEYSVDIGVFKYSDEFPDKDDVIKTIVVNVDYTTRGVTNNFKLTTLKERKI